MNKKLIVCVLLCSTGTGLYAMEAADGQEGKKPGAPNRPGHRRTPSGVVSPEEAQAMLSTMALVRKLSPFANDKKPKVALPVPLRRAMRIDDATRERWGAIRDQLAAASAASAFSGKPSIPKPGEIPLLEDPEEE